MTPAAATSPLRLAAYLGLRVRECTQALNHVDLARRLNGLYLLRYQIDCLIAREEAATTRQAVQP